MLLYKNENHCHVLKFIIIALTTHIIKFRMILNGSNLLVITILDYLFHNKEKKNEFKRFENGTKP